jgi:hypothetical protein
MVNGGRLKHTKRGIVREEDDPIMDGQWRKTKTHKERNSERRRRPYNGWSMAED